MEIPHRKKKERSKKEVKQKYEKNLKENSCLVAGEVRRLNIGDTRKYKEVLEICLKALAEFPKIKAFRKTK